MTTKRTATKRDFLTRRKAISIFGISISASLPSVFFARPATASSVDDSFDDEPRPKVDKDASEPKPVQVHYLEIVTNDVDAVCENYSKMLGVTFGEKDKNLGGARTCRIAHGGLLGVRAPMHDGEKPVVRPYVLVDDIPAAVAKASQAGAKIALPLMVIPGHGKCAIYMQGGIEFGLWQV
jgi:uncharacterized protein